MSQLDYLDGLSQDYVGPGQLGWNKIITFAKRI